MVRSWVENGEVVAAVVGAVAVSPLLQCWVKKKKRKGVFVEEWEKKEKGCVVGS